MIFAKIHITPLPGKRDAVLELLRHIQGAVRGRAGCLNSEIYEQCSRERAILYLEQWHSVEELSRYIQSDLYLRVLLTLELACRQPEIGYFDVSDVKGMAWVEDLRTQYEKLT